MGLKIDLTWLFLILLVILWHTILNLSYWELIIYFSKIMKLVICNSISVDSISTDLLNEHWALSDWALRITAIILKDYAKINKHKTSISSLCYSSKKSPKFLTKHTVFKPLNITRDISLSKHSPKGLNHLSNIKI